MDAGRSRCHQTNCSTDWSSLLVLPPTKTSESGVLCDTLKIFLCEYERMPKVSVEIPQELLDDLDEHVGDEESSSTEATRFEHRSAKHSICSMRSMNDTDGLRQTKLSLTSRTHWNRRCTTDCVSAVS